MSKGKLTKPTARPCRDLTARESRIMEMWWSAEKLAVFCAVKIGAELLALKEELPHGRFAERVEKIFPFTMRTATKYMQLADQLQAKLLAKSEPGSDLKNEPGSLLALPESTIRAAVEGKTLTQLYFDFGIVKRPLSLPPARPLNDSEALKKEIRENRDKFEEALARLEMRKGVMDDETRAAIGYHCARHCQQMIPDGWKILVHTHNGKTFTIEQTFSKHLGLEAFRK